MDASCWGPGPGDLGAAVSLWRQAVVALEHAASCGRRGLVVSSWLWSSKAAALLDELTEQQPALWSAGSSRNGKKCTEK